MHPLLRNLVIAGVGLLIAGGLTAIAVLGENSDVSVAAMVGSGLVTAAVGGFLFVQGWLWSQRACRRGATGRAVAIAFAGGIMLLIGAAALAATVVLVLLFNDG